MFNEDDYRTSWLQNMSRFLFFWTLVFPTVCLFLLFSSFKYFLHLFSKTFPCFLKSQTHRARRSGDSPVSGLITPGGKTEAQRVEMVCPQQLESRSLTQGPKFFLLRNAALPLSENNKEKEDSSACRRKIKVSYLEKTNNNITYVFVVSKILIFWVKELHPCKRIKEKSQLN